MKFNYILVQAIQTTMNIKKMFYMRFSQNYFIFFLTGVHDTEKNI